MANTLAHYDMAKVTAVKCFTLQARSVKLFVVIIEEERQNKLERLSLAGLSNLV